MRIRKIAISPPRLTVNDTGNLPPPLGGPFHTAPGSLPPAMVICRPAVSAMSVIARLGLLGPSTPKQKLNMATRSGASLWRRWKLAILRDVNNRQHPLE